MKNEISHNHDEDGHAYKSFVASATVLRRFGKNKDLVENIAWGDTENFALNKD